MKIFLFNKKGFVAANTQVLKNWINSRFVIEMECSLLDAKNLELFYNSKLQQLKQTNTTTLSPSSTTQVAIQNSVEEKVDPIAAKRHPTRKRHRDDQHELEFSNDNFPTTISPVSNSQHLATSSLVAKPAQMIAMSPMVAVMPPIVAVMPPIVAVPPPIVAVPPGSQTPPVVPSPPSVSQSAVGKQMTQESNDSENKDKQAPNNGNLRPKRKFEASSCEEPKSKKPKKEKQISKDEKQKPQISQKKRGKRKVEEKAASHPNPKRPKTQDLPIEMSLENLPESCDTMTIEQQLTESRDPTTLTNPLTQSHDPMDLDE